MHFPALVSWGRRLGRWFLYELLRLALGVALGLRLLGSLRSALGGGGRTNGAPRGAGPAVRPRRPGARRGRAPFPQPAAA
ncbi:MAG: hypothetical protein ACRYFR_16280 [Janthinobacterium lividum]